LFIGSMFGGRTLEELRGALLAAEAETADGAGLRIAPMADVRALGGLLQRAGYALPVVDTDVASVRYRDLGGLFRDLRAMGETSAMAEKQPRLRRATLLRLFALYQERHGEPDGRVRATFEILTASGWRPHESQQKPLKPGSAQRSLAEAIKGRPAD
jgi:hypothetical protein